MVVALAWAFLVVVLAILACVVAFPEQRARPRSHGQLLSLPLLLAAATAVSFYVPPSSDLDEPAVWMAALVAGVAGVGRGAWISFEVDHRRRLLRLRRAPEAFWVALAAALLVVAGILAEPVGRFDSSFIQTVELGLTVLTSFAIGRNATVLVRSRDIPQHDL